MVPRSEHAYYSLYAEDPKFRCVHSCNEESFLIAIIFRIRVRAAAAARRSLPARPSQPARRSLPAATRTASGADHSDYGAKHDDVMA